MNYYELLGVNQTASKEEIKSAYKKQMKKWHPDINKDANAVNMSSKINEAKEVLLDDIKRKDYDEYLNKKVEENYNRYTQNRKAQKENNNQNNQSAKTYEDDMVTKWQYLKQWLKYGTDKIPRKVLGLIGILLESFMCFIIKSLIIILAYACNIGSYIIRSIFYALSPLFGILILLFIGQCILGDGFIKTIKTADNNVITFIITTISLFVASMVLPLISKAILSPKVFDILYNKIDVTLFKKCVGYKDYS